MYPLPSAESPYALGHSADGGFWRETSDIVERVARIAGNFAGGVRRTAHYFSEEHPFRLIACVAAIGFSSGILLRLMRSRHG
jgi:hypothetical protein